MNDSEISWLSRNIGTLIKRQPIRRSSALPPYGLGNEPDICIVFRFGSIANALEIISLSPERMAEFCSVRVDL